MCTKNELEIIAGRIAQCASEVFEDIQCNTILYGSYARGDYDSESDIDIIILVDLPKEDLFKYKKPFLHLSSELGMEYDIVITVNIKDFATFNKYCEALPYYRNIAKEGVLIA